jgi:SRSO17 transposase
LVYAAGRGQATDVWVGGQRVVRAQQACALDDSGRQQDLERAVAAWQLRAQELIRAIA